MNSAVLSATPDQKTLPGDFAMWVFILVELSTFAVFFITFKVAEKLQSTVFLAGKENISISIGLICTIALIFSSYLVALSVKALKTGDQQKAKKMLIASLLTTTVYIVAKLTEYHELGNAGIGLSTNDFYTLYYFMTAFHFMHVVFGMVILTYMAIKCHRQQYNETINTGFEAGASYWHMIDLLWIIIFYLVYLVH